MLDIGWSELLVIALVAIMVIPPKDLPRALRTVGNHIGNLKRMAGTFQRQLTEALRDEETEKLRRELTQLGSTTESQLRQALAPPPVDSAKVRQRMLEAAEWVPETEGVVARPVQPATPPAPPAPTAVQPAPATPAAGRDG